MRILVIEDEPRILEFLRLGLEAEGFMVDGADDGAIGLGLALTEPYELVILDLLLPRLDGFRLLGELRQARPDLPVLILSARSDLPTKLRGFGLGANDYLSKPFSFDELVARVRVHLRKGHDVGGLVELACRPAETRPRSTPSSGRRLGRSTSPTGSSGFSTTSPHMPARSSVASGCSPTCGATASIPGSNVVDVCVRRLRKKLGPTWPIETVRHAGYRLAVA